MRKKIAFALNHSAVPACWDVCPASGDNGTIQHSMQGRMDMCYRGGECDIVVKPGTGTSVWKHTVLHQFLGHGLSL